MEVSEPGRNACEACQFFAGLCKVTQLQGHNAVSTSGSFVDEYVEQNRLDTEGHESEALSFDHHAVGKYQVFA